MPLNNKKSVLKDMEQWILKIKRLFESCSGKALSQELKLTNKDSGKTDADVFNLTHIKNCHFYIGNFQPEDICTNFLDSPYDEIVAYHLTAAIAIIDKKYSKAFTAHTMALECYQNKLFNELKEQNWTLDLLYTMLLDQRRIARIADLAELAICKSKINKNSPVGEQSMLERCAANQHMAAFRTCVSDNRTSENQSKKWGILFIVNQLFKIYFMINKLHLLKPLLRAVETNTLKDRFPLSQRVTYNFFRGRKELFENHFDSAIDCLTFAFEKCHKESHINQKQVLLYLIPVKMLRGTLPSEDFLANHDLTNIFGGIVRAIKTGDLKLFDDTMNKNHLIFVKNRTLITIEKLRTIVERTLFRKVHKIMEKVNTGKTNNHILPVQVLHDSLSDYENKVRDHY